MNRVLIGARDYGAVTLGGAERLYRQGVALVAEGDGRILKLYARRRRWRREAGLWRARS